MADKRQCSTYGPHSTGANPSVGEAPVSRYNSKEFGKHLRSLRRARGQTQRQLGHNSQLSADTIRRLERGDFNASLETVARVAHGLGLPLSTLFESYELGDVDDRKRILGLLTQRPSSELPFIVELLELLLAELDARGRRRG